MKALADISNMMGDYKDVVAFLSLHVKRRTCKSVIGKLVFSASVYYIWQERNARIFSNQKRSSCQLKEVIHSAVRIKLLSCSFKKTRSGLVFARIWKLPENRFPPLDNPELTIRRRSRVDPTLLNDFEIATDGNGDPPVPTSGLWSSCASQLLMAGVDQLPRFQFKQQILDLRMTIKVNGVTDDALRLYLFPHSLTHHATVWFDRLPRNSINTFEQMAKMLLGKYFPPSMVMKLRNEITNFHQCPDESLFKAWEHYKLSIDRCPNHNVLPVTQIDTFYNGLTLRHRDTINAAAGGTFMKRRPKECDDLIENMTTHHNDWDTSVQRSESSSSMTSSSDPEIIALKATIGGNQQKSHEMILIRAGKCVTQLFSGSDNSLEGMTQSGSGVAGLSSFRTGFIQSGLAFNLGRFAVLTIKELGAVLNLKHPNHVFSFYLDLNLGEEEGLNRHDAFFVTCPFQQGTHPCFLDPLMPQELRRVQHVHEAICKSHSRTFIDEDSLSLSFYSSAATRFANSESDVLCYGGGGGSGRIDVIGVVFAVKIGA
nr:reverse transcriptase domain-containing protein [Tanacetum cinerariifolium]